MRSFSKILCLVPGEASATAVLARAAGIADDNQASLTAVGLVEPLPADGLRKVGVSPEALRAALVDAEARRLEALAAPWRSQVHIETRVLVGRPFPDVARLAITGGHDLLVKAPEPVLGLLHRLRGSEDMHLLRKCPCAVWLVDPAAPAGYRCVLAAVDVDEVYSASELTVRRALNLRIAATAASVAIAQLAELHLVHAWTAIGVSVMRSALVSASEAQICAYVDGKRAEHRAAMDRLLQSLEAHIGSEAMRYAKPRVHLLEGDAREVIPALAGRILPDLTVLGTVARTGVRGFLIGNTAESLLHQLDGSILALKPQGFVSPLDTDS